eukprot:TRINITY_DN7143_c0_g1_i1.p1 TRINITY_DN7143_c0_g1~~TRINITY_DN7143_c0_g1_i1.p1  ORF type:complete len:467 (-),score=106.49 TRINITY_DN7143_c0_g1_i1:355-1755(-)
MIFEDMSQLDSTLSPVEIDDDKSCDSHSSSHGSVTDHGPLMETLSVPDSPSLMSEIRPKQQKVQHLQFTVIRLSEENEQLRHENVKLTKQMMDYRRAFEQAVWKQKAAERTTARLDREMRALMAALAPDGSVKIIPAAAPDEEPTAADLQLPVLPHASSEPQGDQKYMWESNVKTDRYGISIDNDEEESNSFSVDHLKQDELRSLVIQQRKKIQVLEVSKQKVLDELEELTEKLFEESNKLVRDEAAARWELQQMNEKLERQLADLRQTLRFENSQRKALQEKLRNSSSLEDKYARMRTASAAEAEIKASSDAVQRVDTPRRHTRKRSQSMEFDRTVLALRSAPVELKPLGAAAASRRKSIERRGAVNGEHSRNASAAEVEIELPESQQLSEFMDFLARSKSVTDGAFPERLIKEDVEPVMGAIKSRSLRSKLSDSAISGDLSAQPIGFCGVSYVVVKFLSGCQMD